MRPIDADILPNYDCLATAKVGEMSGPVKWRFVLWEDVEKAPTVDAVPVVRCRDCVYATHHAHAVVGDNGEISLAPLWGCQKLDWFTTPDGFCCWGKPREEDLHETD